MESAEDKILKRIRGKGRGSIVFQSDYAECGSPASIKSAFYRLYSDGTLIRLAQGIYYYPKYDKELGLGIIYPSIEQIAEAIAKRDRVKIVPTGVYALNKLGLSDQIPMNVVFVTNGAPRRIQVGKRNGILFKHSSSGKMFAYKSDMMMLVVSAMREIGQGSITENQILKLRKYVNQVGESEFAHDIKLAPIWIRQILMTQ